MTDYFYGLSGTEKNILESDDFQSIKNYFAKVDWGDLLELFLTKALLVCVVIAALFFVHYFGTILIHFGFAKLKNRGHDIRGKTLFTLSKNILNYTLLLLFLFSILSIFDISVGSLLAGAGIVGLAIGLGAKGFIEDIITGFLIMMERQIDVGDIVIINDIKGMVVAVGLRTIQIKSENGTLNFLPNRSISLVSNISRHDMLVQIDFRVSPSEDMDKVKTIIEATNKYLIPLHQKDIRNGPDILGFMDSGNSNFVYRIIMYVKNGQQEELDRIFLQAYMAALRDANIEVTMPQFISTVVGDEEA